MSSREARLALTAAINRGAEREELEPLEAAALEEAYEAGELREQKPQDGANVHGIGPDTDSDAENPENAPSTLDSAPGGTFQRDPAGFPAVEGPAPAESEGGTLPNDPNATAGGSS